MQPYGKYAPTPLDTKGLALPDRQDWLVGPCTLSRDSDAVSRANWQALLNLLRATDGDFEVHRFGHWACGWFELLLVRPGSAAETMAHDAESALADYPILDDELFSLEEHSDAIETWRAMRHRERRTLLRESGDNPRKCRNVNPPSSTWDRLR